LFSFSGREAGLEVGPILAKTREVGTSKCEYIKAGRLDLGLNQAQLGLTRLDSSLVKPKGSRLPSQAKPRFLGVKPSQAKPRSRLESRLGLAWLGLISGSAWLGLAWLESISPRRIDVRNVGVRNNAIIRLSATTIYQKFYNFVSIRKEGGRGRAPKTGTEISKHIT